MAMSYTGGLRMRGLFLAEIGLDKSKYGLHSLREGGASVASSAGIPDRW